MSQNSNPPTQTQTTPLAEANPDSLSELFSRDPLRLQRQDIALIVAELRRAREQWVLAEAKGAKRAPTGIAKPNLNLSDLEL